MQETTITAIKVTDQPTFLFFTTETAPTYAGDGLNALLLAQTLAGKGYMATIICLNPYRLLPDYEEYNAVSVLRVPYLFKTRFGRAMLRFRMVWKVFKIGRQYSTWMIYGAMPTHRLVILSGWLLGKKIVFRSTLYGFDNASSLVNSGRGLQNRVKKWILGRVNGYYALNSKFANDWINLLRQSNNIFVSPQGVCCHKYNQNNYSKAELRHELNLPDNTVLLVMVGHLIQRKGFPQIFEWLSQIGGDFLLIQVGRNSAPEWDIMNRKNLEMSRIKELGKKMLGNRILFIGDTNRVNDYLTASDIFLLNSQSEGFPPNSLNEAMAAGLPILSKNTYGYDDFLEDGINALIYSNVAEFTSKLKLLLSSAELRTQMGASAQMFTLGKNDIAVVANNFLGFIGSID